MAEQRNLGTLSVSLVADIQNFLNKLREARDLLRETAKLQQDVAQPGQKTIRVSGIEQLSRNIKALTGAFNLFNSTLGISAKESAAIAAAFGQMGASMQAAGAAAQNMGGRVQAQGQRAKDTLRIFREIGKVAALVNREMAKSKVVGVAGPIGAETIERWRQMGRATQQVNRQFGTLQQQIVALGGGDGRGGFFGALTSGWIEGIKRIIIFQTRWYMSYQLIFGAVRTVRGAISTFIEFGDVMAQVQAIAATSANETKRLAEAARDMGRTTIVSATEAAKGLQLLAQAGFTAGESIDAIRAVTAVAIGGVSTMDESVKLLTTSLRAFKLDASKADEVANILVGTVNQSKTDIDGLNTTFNFAANSAAAAGLAFRDLAAIVGVLADNGIRASTQGTAVRQVIAALVNPTDRAEKVFDRLGLTLGELNPLANDIVDIFKRMRAAGFGAEEAFQAFERRTGAAAIALIRNAEAIEDMRERITGTDDAYRAFAQRQQSLASQIAIATNNFKDLAISIGEDFLPVFRGVIKLWNDLAKYAGQLKSAIYALATSFALLAGVRGIGGLIMYMRGGLAVAAWLETLATGSYQAAGAINILTASLAGLWAVLRRFLIIATIAAGLYSLFELFRNLKRPAEELAESFDDQTDTANALSVSMSKVTAQLEGAIDAFLHAEEGSSQWVTALADIDRLVAQLTMHFPNLSDQIAILAHEAKTGMIGMKEFAEAMRELIVEAPLRNLIANMEAERQRLQIQMEQLREARESRQFTGRFGIDDWMSAAYQIRQLQNEISALDQKLAAAREQFRRTFRESAQEIDWLREAMAEVEDAVRFAGPEEAARRMEHLTIAASGVAASMLELTGVTREGEEKASAFAKTFVKLYEDNKLSVDDLTRALKKMGEEIDDSTKRQLGAVVAIVKEGAKYVTDFAAGLDKVSQIVADVSRGTEELAAKTLAKQEAYKLKLEAIQQTYAAGGTPAEAEEAGRVAEAWAELTATLEKLEKERQKKILSVGRETREELERLAESADAAEAKRAQTKLDEMARINEAYRKRALEEQKAAEVELEKSQVSSRHRTLKAIHSANIQVARASGQLYAQQLRNEGKLRAALEQEYATRAHIIDLRTTDPELKQVLLTKNALEEKVAVEKLELQLLEQNIRTEEKLEDIRRRAIEDEGAYRDRLLDLEEQRAELGETNLGAEQARELIERQRLQNQINTKAKLIEQTTADLAKAQERSKQEGKIGEEAKKRVAALKEVIAAETKDLTILNEKLKLVRQAGTVVVNLGNMFSDAIGQAFEGIIRGTSKLKDVFKNLGNALLSSITQALAKSLVAKLGFDRSMKLNFLDLGKFIYNTLSGSTTGALEQAAGSAEGKGLGSKLFDVVFGRFKGLGNALQGWLGGAQTVLGTGVNAGFTAQVAGGATQMLTTPSGAVISTTGAYIPSQAMGASGIQLGGELAGLGGTGAAGSAGAATGGKILGMGAGQFLGAVGSLISLGLTIKDFIKWMGDAKKATAGQSGPASWMRGFGAVSMGVGIGGGAAAGAAIGSVFPGIGTVVGAIVGAAVGAAVSQAINSAVSGAVGKGTEKAVRKGMTQEELEDEVRSNLGLNVVRGVLGGGLSPLAETMGLGKKAQFGIFGGMAGLGLGPLGLTSMGLTAAFDAIIGSMIPDIEKIYDQMFRDIWEKAGIELNRQQEKWWGQGLTKKGKERLAEFFKGDDELRSRAKDTIQLVAGLIGAGMENHERLARFWRIFANSMANTKRYSEEVYEVLNRMLRFLSGGSFIKGLELVDRMISKPVGRNTEVYMRQMRNMIAAYKDLRFFEGLDLEGWAEVAIRSGSLKGRVKKLGRKPAKKAGEEALESFLTADTYEEGLEGFKNSLRESVKSAMIAGFQQALLWNGPIGAMMTDFFGTTAKLFKKMLKKGPTDNLLEKLERQTDVAMNDLGRYFNLLEGWLPGIYDMVNGLLERLDEQMKTALDRWKEEIARLDVVDQVMNVWSEAFFKITNLYRALADTQTRLTQKIFSSQQKTEDQSKQAPGVALTYLKAAASQQFMFLTTIKDIFDPEVQLKALGQIEDTIDAFLQSAVREISEFFGPAIEQARKATELAEAIADTIHGLNLSSLSPRTTQEKLAGIRTEIEDQKKLLLQGSPEEQLEAAQKLRDLNADLLEIGRAELDQAGPMFRALFDEVTSNLTTLEETLRGMGMDLEELEARQEHELRLIREQAGAYYEWLQNESMPLIEEELRSAGETLDKMLAELIDKLGIVSDFPVKFEELGALFGEFITTQTGSLGEQFLGLIDALTGSKGQNLAAQFANSTAENASTVVDGLNTAATSIVSGIAGEIGTLTLALTGEASPLLMMSDAMQTLVDPENGPLAEIYANLGTQPGRISSALANGALHLVSPSLQDIKKALYKADQKILDLILTSLNALAKGQQPPPTPTGETEEPPPPVSWEPTHEPLVTRVEQAYMTPWHENKQRGGFGARNWDVQIATDAVMTLLFQAIDTKVASLGRGDTQKATAAAFATTLKSVLQDQRNRFAPTHMTYLQVSGLLEQVKWVFQNSAPAGVQGMDKAKDHTLNWFLNRIGSLPHLAEGAIIEKPTVAMVGEAGREAVIPLNENSIQLLTDSLAEQLSRTTSFFQEQFRHDDGQLLRTLIDATRRVAVEIRRASVELQNVLHDRAPFIVPASTVIVEQQTAAVERQRSTMVEQLLEKLLAATERLIESIYRLTPEHAIVPPPVILREGGTVEPFAEQMIFLLERIRDGQEATLTRMAISAAQPLAAQAHQQVAQAQADVVQQSTTTVNLQVAEGAFTATLHNADTAVVQELPERMLEQFERSIRHGRLGAAIERRVKR